MATRAELDRLPVVERVLWGKARADLAEAKRLAREHRDTGALEEHLRLERGADGLPVLVCDDPDIESIEFGTADTEPLAILRRAIRGR